MLPALVLLAAAALASDQPVGRSTGGTIFRILQLNLCNSGAAPCYRDGEAIREARALIDALRPSAVFFDEICRSDLPRLADNGYYHYPARIFAPAWNTVTGSNYRCTGGRGDYGSGIIVDNSSVLSRTHGKYAAQQPGSDEHRVYGCALFRHFVGCATHLTVERPIAMSQCNQLMRDVLPSYLARIGAQGLPTVVSGDLNLVDAASDPFGVAGCVPPGHTRRGDGGLQHVIVSRHITLETVQAFRLRHTDHDAVHLTAIVPWEPVRPAHRTNTRSPEARQLMRGLTVRTLTRS